MEGTLWSGSLFSFTSPIDTIMDKDDYTIEELLAEDELLQEIKSNNTRLITKLSEEDSVEAIVRYMSEPAPEGADDLRLHKYPYMSCEVLCCEVNSLIDAVVEAKGGALMEQLFSVITSPKPASDRLAGYFEKVLNVVFRRKSVDVMAFLDRKGPSLFQDFCRQLHNYSVMQSLRILLLPAVQLAREDSGLFMEEDCDSSNVDEALAASLQCNWHRDDVALNHLVQHLTTTTTTTPTTTVTTTSESRAHASELLISVIDLSGRTSLFHKTLTSAKTLKALADSAVPPITAKEEGNNGDDAAAAATAAAVGSPTAALDADSDKAGSVVASLSVLEVAVVQFCDESALQLVQQAALELEAAAAAAAAATAATTAGGDAAATAAAAAAAATASGNGQQLPSTAVPADSVTELCALVPRVAAYLRSHASDARTVATQMSRPKGSGGGSGNGAVVPRLGLARLKLVNLVEALLRLAHPQVDKALVEAGMLSLLLDLFFKYQWNSMLHQSVMASVMLVVEGKSPATTTPGENSEDPSAAAAAVGATGAAASAGNGDGSGGEGGATPPRETLQRHLILDAQLLERVMKVLGEQTASEKAARDAAAAAGGGEAQAPQALAPPQRPGLFGHAVVMCESVMKGIVGGGFMADLVSASPAGPAWHDFMLGALSEITAVQCRPIGGYAYPNRHEGLDQGSDGGFRNSMGGSGDSNDDDDDEKLNDEALAEQISKLGLNYGGGGYGGGGDNDDSDDEEENAIAAAALAAAYGLGSGLGMNNPSESGSGGRNGDGSGQGMGMGGIGDDDDDSDDEEEQAVLAAALAQAYGGRGSSLGMAPPPQVSVAAAEAASGVGGGGGFADFDAFASGVPPSTSAPSSATEEAAASMTNPPPNNNSGQAVEANDFANWGDFASPSTDTSSATGGTFADFADFGGGGGSAAPAAAAAAAAPTTTAVTSPSSPAPSFGSPTGAEPGSPASLADLSPASPADGALRNPPVTDPSPPPAASSTDASGASSAAASAPTSSLSASEAGLDGGNPLFQASFEANLSAAAPAASAATPAATPAAIPAAAVAAAAAVVDPFVAPAPVAVAADPFAANFDAVLAPSTTPAAMTAGAPAAAAPSTAAPDPFGGFDAFASAAPPQQQTQKSAAAPGLGGIDAFAAFK